MDEIVEIIDRFTEVNRDSQKSLMESWGVLCRVFGGKWKKFRGSWVGREYGRGGAP